MHNKVKQIETVIVDLPTIRPHKLSMTTMAKQTMVIVTIRDDDGVTGIGEATTIGGLSYGVESPESIKLTIDQYIRPLLLDQPAANINLLRQKLDKVICGNNLAKSAIETALLDLKGKRLGQSVADLLGGAQHQHLPVLWTLASGDTDKDIAEARDILSQGRHKDFKLKIGFRELEQDIQHACRIKQALGEQASVRVDVNQAWDESTAFIAIQQLQDGGIDLIEQPTPKKQLDALTRLSQYFHVPILADEAVADAEDGAILAKLGFRGAYALKIAKAGGPASALKLAHVAQANGIGLYGGTLLEGSIGTVASLHAWSCLPHLNCGTEMFGPLLLIDDIVTQPLNFHNNGVDLPSGPGLGLELDQDKIKFYAR